MYRLQHLNIIIETENEIQKDRLIMQGYTLLDHREGEDTTSDNSSSEVVSSQDYKKYKAEELRKIATEKNLSVTEGMTKKELVELLEKSEKSEENESA
ncbi:hypothetical protein [Filifactor villosus]|uniref:Rho termination factor N-terminal domain-containing protein n=1 Tax=Filifactor villosus TaxID=29374 RepID=A0ABV9QM21_9FIRM